MSCVSRSDVGAENVPLSYLDMLATVVDLAPAGGMNRPARFESARALSRRSARVVRVAWYASARADARATHRV